MGVYDEELFNLERDVLRAVHTNGHVPSKTKHVP
jgi:hypothetical protein